MPRSRSAKIVATLGPASSTEAQIRALFDAGVDVFRLNFSHGSRAEHAERVRIIRRIEEEVERTIGVLLDLQGPKLRIGTLAEGEIRIGSGDRWRLDMDPTPGDTRRAPLLHPEIFAAVHAGTNLLVDDGKIRLRVDKVGADFVETTVLVGGPVSDQKGVNVPGVVLPIGSLTAKDRQDLAFGLELEVDWVALSFVQRPQDIEEARTLITERAWIMAKLEKPSAIEYLEAIVKLCDGIMVARGDLGVEMALEQVPELQRRIVRLCRRLGKPVVVATQMLESMIASPVPTRAEVSDVATAVYDGVDAVMLSAESAVGVFPREAVSVMDRIIARVEQDPAYRVGLDATYTSAEATVPDAMCYAMQRVVGLVAPAVIVTYTSSGFTGLRAARERPPAPILSMTPNLAVARRLALVWGVHALSAAAVHEVGEMVEHACRAACEERLARPGEYVAILAGLPFGRSGTTNLLHIARITD
jgi:pyruvate kinase